MDFIIIASERNVSRDGPVEVFCFIENELDDAVWFNSRFGVKSGPDSAGEIRFELTGPVGPVEFAARINMVDPEEIDFTLLAPEASVGKLIDLNWYYDFSEPGEYSIQAFYHNTFENDRYNKATFIEDEIASETIRIIIK